MESPKSGLQPPPLRLQSSAPSVSTSSPEGLAMSFLTFGSDSESVPSVASPGSFCAIHELPASYGQVINIPIDDPFRSGEPLESCDVSDDDFPMSSDDAPSPPEIVLDSRPASPLGSPPRVDNAKSRTIKVPRKRLREESVATEGRVTRSRTRAQLNPGSAPENPSLSRPSRGSRRTSAKSAPSLTRGSSKTRKKPTTGRPAINLRSSARSVSIEQDDSGEEEVVDDGKDDTDEPDSSPAPSLSAVGRVKGARRVSSRLASCWSLGSRSSRTSQD
ncbi:hypothetical protein B0H10DRAFT_2437104 [Mycena sp. CBHHK59/15]|nr:hypothetical protein B0H10DRAFT_2437104 [Mycena sp. CBHHK59/15]